MTMEGSEGTTIVNEVPETLKTLCLLLTKTFYGLHHYVLLDYIQRLGCVKEDKLRDLLKLDPRYLRTLIVTLKVDKFLKERTIAEENEGRSRKVNYYHVNYKAILNVTKYKIDHMRQKLEHKEHTHVQKASYICSNCKRHYEALDIRTIMNMETGELVCWQCNGKVVADETAGPSDETRSSLAKFNEDMAGIFSMLQQLDGIRFSRQILEPPITVIRDEPKEFDKTERLQVGARMFSNVEKTRSDLYANGIMVSIGERQEIQIESKEKVPWLQHTTHDEGPHLPEAPSTALSGISLDSKSPESLEPSLLAPLLGDVAITDIGTLVQQSEGIREHAQEAFSPSRSVHKESVGELPQHNGDVVNGNGTVEGRAEDEDLVLVNGVPTRLEDIDQEAVDRMTEGERRTYVEFVASSVFF